MLIVGLKISVENLNYHSTNQNKEQVQKQMLELMERIQKIINEAKESDDHDQMRSAFLLVDALFSFHEEEMHNMIIQSSVQQLFTVIDQYLIALNAEIISLNNVLTEDQLQLSMENAQVLSIIRKVELLGSFFGMCQRVLGEFKAEIQQLTSFYRMVINPFLSSIFIRVFGIGIAIPNSPNNNSVIQITGLQALDKHINQLKIKSMECINMIMKVQNQKVQQIIQAKQHQIINGLHNLIPILIQSLVIFG
mmetsp:Transcript_12871/g.21771  ORF Transcript_12871/g.21771 Transcript_12871/m.21771 type:complete len:250 (-) Transcript_12871:2473-3222(-)